MRCVAPDGTAAVLTPGHADPRWYGHLWLARELFCALVEGGDLTVREGGLYLKTLRGLQPIAPLIRGTAGGSIDPLELVPDGNGVPGLLAAARDHVRILNSPGSGVVEAPAFAAFLCDLAIRLLGQPLLLPGNPTIWLGNADSRAAALANPADWHLRPAFEGVLPPTPLAEATEAQWQAVPEQLAAAPWQFARKSHCDTLGCAVFRW